MAANKKQQTLSAFFSKPKPKPAPAVVSVAGDAAVDADEEEPQAKRRKLSSAPTEDQDEEDEEPLTRLRQSSGNVQRQRTVPLSSPSKRTSKYLFSSSPQKENQDDETDNTADVQRKQELHRKFVKKLGKPDSIADIKRRNKALFEDEEAEHDEDEAEDEASQAEKPAGRGKATKKGGSKLTPMEKQVIDIKRAHMDTILVVEVGYKFRFFGEDARIAARELSIVCIPGKFRYDEHPSEAHLDRFASASIPVHRLHVHVKRLVAAGHKVGVVRQLETAALKAAGDNRNAPFVRKLTNLYTKGTYIDDIEGLEQDTAAASSQSSVSGFLLCITEVNLKGYGDDEKVHVGIVAVQPATGDVVYDDFEDGFMRSEIETRLLHIAPCEVLVVGDLSKATDKLVTHLSGGKMNVFGDKVRIERVNKHKTIAADSYSQVASFYADKMKDTPTKDGKAPKVLEKILGLPEHVMVCLSAMINHLSEYGLQNVFDLTKYFQPFSARSHMLVNANTLTSLEIYQNQTDHSVKGSLFWTLDRTQTKFGGRLLRKWVGRPLLDKSRIEARLEAIEELLDTENSIAVDKLRRMLSNIRTDLEKSLLRIYYGKCTRPELLHVLRSLQTLAAEFSHVTSAAATGFKSDLISSAITSLPPILAEAVEYLNRINLEAAQSDDKYDFLREEFETKAITEHKFGIVSIEHDLDTFRSQAAETIGLKKAFDYKAVAGIDYLIEIENNSSYIKKVPASWAKISGTKKVSRFHPPEVIRMIRERDQHKESLAAACDVAFKDLLAEISIKYQLFRDTILSLATLDCLLSLATVAAQPGYTKPTFSSSGPTQLNIQGARHPMVEQLLLEAYVPNDISLSNDVNSTRALLVTGPNMGGKSSYVRSVALIVIMAQIGSFVPAVSADLGILDAVFTRMGAFDNMMTGESTFMVELSETSDILKLATDRSLVVLDELGRGTSTHDGVAIAASVLDFLVREKRCLTLFITHYQVLARMADIFRSQGGELKNVHMRFSQGDTTAAASAATTTTPDDDNHDNITFLYEVGEGVAHRSYGLNVARLAGLSGRVIETARLQSAGLESRMRQRRLEGVLRELTGHGNGDDDGDGGHGAAELRLASAVDGIVEAIETL